MQASDCQLAPSSKIVFASLHYFSSTWPLMPKYSPKMEVLEKLIMNHSGWHSLESIDENIQLHLWGTIENEKWFLNICFAVQLLPWLVTEHSLELEGKKKKNAASGKTLHFCSVFPGRNPDWLRLVVILPSVNHCVKELWRSERDQVSQPAHNNDSVQGPGSGTLMMSHQNGLAWCAFCFQRKQYLTLKSPDVIIQCK